MVDIKEEAAERESSEIRITSECPKGRCYSAAGKWHLNAPRVDAIVRRASGAAPGAYPSRERQAEVPGKHCSAMQSWAWSLNTVDKTKIGLNVVDKKEKKKISNTSQQRGVIAAAWQALDSHIRVVSGLITDTLNNIFETTN